MRQEFLTPPPVMLDYSAWGSSALEEAFHLLNAERLNAVYAGGLKCDIALLRLKIAAIKAELRRRGNPFGDGT